MQGNIVKRTLMTHLIDSSQYDEETGNASRPEDGWILRDFEAPGIIRNEQRLLLSIRT
jgi:hypothetical protein